MASKAVEAKQTKRQRAMPFNGCTPGQSVVLLDIKEQGIIQRIWLTINQSPKLLRSLRLQMFWDRNTKAAVDVPLGDFLFPILVIPPLFSPLYFQVPKADHSIVLYLCLLKRGAHYRHQRVCGGHCKIVL
ncbi:MAG: hypothetical protein WKG06_17700 [Segetibacter sp.]